MEDSPSWLQQRLRGYARANRWPFLLLQLLLLVLLLVPARDVYRVVSQRFDFPYELEWMEGDVAIMALRFQVSPSLTKLYPTDPEAEFHPHIYPPVYPMALAAIFQWQDSAALQWGRGLSLFGTGLTLLAIIFIVREATGKLLPGFLGALLYVAAFKVSGYWYDLVRIDSLAFGLALWSVYFLMRRRGGAISILLGVLLAFLAQGTKQTAVYLPILALVTRVGLELAQFVLSRARLAGVVARGGRLFRSPYGGIVAALFSLIAVVNLVLVLRRSEALDGFHYFVYDLPRVYGIVWPTLEGMGRQELWQHSLYLVWLLPTAVWATGLAQRWKGLSTALVAIAAGLATTILALILMIQWGELRYPDNRWTSVHAITYVIGLWPSTTKLAAALTVGGLGLWAVRWLFYRSVLRGAWWIGVLLVSQHVAAVTWVKVGGYINNLMPLVAVQSIVFGLCIGWLYGAVQKASARRAQVALWRPMLATAAAALVIVAILLPTWFGTHWLRDMEQNGSESQDSSTQQNSPEQTLPVPVLPVQRTPPNQIASIPLSIVDGWRFNSVANPLGGQVPDKEDRAAGDAMLERLRALHADGGVYVPHQNYYAHLAGVPISASIDPLWNLTHDGRRGTPRWLIQDLQRKRWKHIVTMMDIQYEWMPGDVTAVIKANYDNAGPLLPGVPGDVVMPVTGARVRPSLVYTAK